MGQPGQAKQLSIRALAAELGKSKSHVARLMGAPWWPKGPDGQPGRDPAAARAAIAASVAERETQPATAAPLRRPPPPELLEQLRNADSTELDRARAIAKAAAWSLAEALATGSLGTKDFGAAKTSVAELRVAENEAFDEAIKRGELIDRELAAAAGAQLAQELVQLLENVQEVLVTRVELWTGDVSWTDLGTEDRGRQVRAWFGGEVREFRERLAEDLGELMATGPA